MNFDVSILLNTKEACNNIFKTLEAIADTYKGSVLTPYINYIETSLVPYNIVLSAVDKWSKEHTDVSCWLEYKESVHLVPDNAIAAVGVRAYANGTLVYSMDGSAIRKSTLEPEETTVREDQLHICKQDKKGVMIVIDGTIDIDIREQKDAYLRFIIDNRQKE